jgi:competence protein ComEC
MLPEPQSSFASGLLIGQRSTIPDSVLADLRTTGLAHIIAVSGYNLTIIIRFIMRYMGRLSRYQKLMVSGSTVVTFLLLTGLSASIVRAAIVCAVSLLAWYYGRSIRPGVLLGFTAALTAYYRPEYVWGDAGWYLSFLAFTGIMIASPILRAHIYRKRDPKFIGQLLTDTISVLMFVTPYSLVLFGNLSLVALPANLLVAPLVPLAMALSALCIVIPTELAVLAVPAEFVLASMLEVSKALSNVPYASLLVKITWAEAFMMYASLCAILFLMWNKKRKRLESNILIQ